MTPDGDAINVAISASHAFVARGAAGIDVHDLASGDVVSTIGVTAHDVAIDDNFVFALDAVGGELSMFDASDAGAPAMVDGPVAVSVGPFTGVSADGGTVIVSGGTGELSARSYDDTGFVGEVLTTDLGRGQPDVLLEGSVAFVSNHFAADVDGAEFGVTALLVGTDLTVGSRVGLPAAGFTPGTATPANFAIESARSGDTLLVAHGGGVAIIGAANPEALSLRTTVPLGFGVMNIDAIGDRAYAIGNHPPLLAVIDIAAGSLLDQRGLAGVPTGVAASEEQIVIAAGPAGLITEAR